PSASPDGPSVRPSVRLQPSATLFDIAVRGRTVTKGRTTAWVARDLNANDFTLFGNVRGRAQSPIRVPVFNPPLFLGALLAERLADDPASLPSTRLPEHDEQFGGAETIAIVTTPLADVVHRCNKVSQNLYADALLKLVGHIVSGEPGSFATGAASIRMIVADRIGADDARQSIIADGSGLSRDNRLTARLLVRWLASFAEDDTLGPVLHASLPSPGEGTLRSWFTDRPLRCELHAKTGYLRGVRALSGYLVHEPSGRRLAFSIIVNNVPARGGSAEAKLVVQRIVRALDAHLAAPPDRVEQPAPANAELGG
ncbi:MAG: D-alanyl-D-alanine carboxypeptidase, partial [Planctomycetota bacterium]